jgi:hypothetical protein
MFRAYTYFHFLKPLSVAFRKGMPFSWVFDLSSTVFAKQACGYNCFFGKSSEKACADALNN